MATTENMTASVDFAEIKKSLAKILDDMAEFAQKYDAVPPPDSFFEARKLLDRKDYNVVVCGEANQGKTSLVNALIGREIFPVKDGIVTSQIFRISHSDKKRFQLVLDDGTNAEISESDLNTYGTESDIVTSFDSILKGRKIKWIEAEVPATFLPEGVHLIDTPGLGSLYGEHSAKTYEWLAKSDAAIFVKSAHRPLDPDEMSCIATIFAVTKNVLFVLSMKDKEDKDVVERRNRGCSCQLTKEFGETENRQFKFWPVSATQFCNAHGNENKERISGMPALKQALENLLERTVGFMAASYADEEACSYWNKTKAFRDERYVFIKQEAEVQKKLLTDKESQVKHFKSEWITAERKKKEVVDDILTSLMRERETALQKIAVDGVLGKEISNQYGNVDAKELSNIVLKKVLTQVADSRSNCLSQLRNVNDMFNDLLSSNRIAFDEKTFKSIDATRIDIYKKAKTETIWQKLDTFLEILKKVGVVNASSNFGGKVGKGADWIFNNLTDYKTGERCENTGKIVFGVVAAACSFPSVKEEYKKRQDKEFHEVLSGSLKSYNDQLAKPIKDMFDSFEEEFPERISDMVSACEKLLDAELSRLQKDNAAPAGVNIRLTNLEEALNAVHVRIDKIHTTLVEYANSIGNSF